MSLGSRGGFGGPVSGRGRVSFGARGGQFRGGREGRGGFGMLPGDYYSTTRVILRVLLLVLRILLVLEYY